MPVAILVLCELGLFFFSLTIAVWIYPTFAHSSFKFELIKSPLLLGLAVINLACLFAAGLYNRDAIRIGSRMSLHLATATALIVIAFATYLMAFTSIYGHRFSNLYALSLLAVCIQFILMFFVRAFFVNIFDVVGFKRCVLLLGDGPLVAKAHAWLADNESGYTDVLRFNMVFAESKKRIAAIRSRLSRSASVATAAELSASQSSTYICRSSQHRRNRGSQETMLQRYGISLNAERAASTSLTS